MLISTLYFGLSSTACSLPLALVPSQRIWPDSLIATASVRMKPVPEGTRVLRLTNPLAVEMKGTCFPALKGLSCAPGHPLSMEGEQSALDGHRRRSGADCLSVAASHLAKPSMTIYDQASNAGIPISGAGIRRHLPHSNPTFLPRRNRFIMLIRTQEVRWESTRTRESKLLRSAVIFGTIKNAAAGDANTNVVRALSLVSRPRGHAQLERNRWRESSTTGGRNISLQFSFPNADNLLHTYLNRRI
jgi:hypothetical protein